MLLSAWATAGAAQALEVKEVSLDTRSEYGRATEEATTVEAALTLNPYLSAQLGRYTQLVAAARIRGDAADELAPGDPQHDTYSAASRPWTPGPDWQVELRDLYLDWRPGSALVRLGKQQIVWGALDGVKVLDVLNPQDFREFILEDFGASRIGLWSAYAELVSGPWRLEVALVPDPTVHELPVEDAWFALKAPRFRFGATRPTTLPVHLERPSDPLEDGAAGLRLSRFLGRAEVTLVATTSLDFEPVGSLDTSMGNPRLTRTYRRRELFGAGFESAFGPFTLRAEASWQPDKALNTRTRGEGPPGLAIVEVDQFRAAIATDVNVPWGWFLNAQFLVDWLDHPPSGVIRPRSDRLATLFLRRSFDYDRFSMELRWYTEVDHHDELYRASVSWRPGGNAELTLAVDAFAGREDGLFGQFANADRVTLVLERTF